MNINEFILVTPQNACVSSNSIGCIFVGSVCLNYHSKSQTEKFTAYMCGRFFKIDCLMLNHKIIMIWEICNWILVYSTCWIWIPNECMYVCMMHINHKSWMKCGILTERRAKMIVAIKSYPKRYCYHTSWLLIPDIVHLHCQMLSYTLYVMK